MLRKWLPGSMSGFFCVSADFGNIPTPTGCARYDRHGIYCTQHDMLLPNERGLKNR
jgi:hypothetical protein